jgi:hypothetical protein
METKSKQPDTKITTIKGSFGNTKGNTKPSSNTMPQSGGPKTPPAPRGSNSK